MISFVLTFSSFFTAKTQDFAGEKFQGVVKDTIDDLALVKLLGADLDKLMQFMRFSQLIGDPETDKVGTEHN